MDKHFTRITITYKKGEDADILVALLSEAGYSGFEEPADSKVLITYILTSNFDEQVLNEIVSSQNCTYEKASLVEENWNQQWESSFSPVIVGDYCAVRAHFHEAIQNVKHEIIITPKMSFGTGHHATTYMMIQCMESLNVKNKTVFDFGTGTGVLAILAEKEGAAKIVAIDNDDWSVENARENIIMNECVAIEVKLDNQPPADEKFDIILANINKHIIIETIPMLAKQLNNEGVLCCSGFYDVDEADISSIAVRYGLQLKERFEKAKWLCLVFQ